MYEQEDTGMASLEQYLTSVRARVARLEAMLRQATENLQRLEQVTQHLDTEYAQNGWREVQ